MQTLPEPRQPRYDSIDVWRGVACLAVVVFHSAAYGLFPYDGGSGELRVYHGVTAWVMELVVRGREGVTLFFVLSGYCIATTVDRSRRMDRPVFRYFRRRARRIYPPYWVALACTAALIVAASAAGGSFLFGHSLVPGNALPEPWRLTLGQWWGNLTLTETWRAQLAGREQFLLGQAWTLCYEEQFYAVFGLILWLCPRQMFKAAVAVSVLTGITYAFATPGSVSGTFLDGRWWLFAIGIGVYYAVNYATRAGWWAWCATLVAAAILAKAGLAPQYARELFIGSAFGLLLLFLHRWDLPIASARALQPLKYCGTICYSLYLIHWPIVKPISHALYLVGVRSAWQTLLVSVPAGVVASLAVAAPFYYYVERRFLNTASVGSQPRVAAAAAAPITLEAATFEVV